MKKEQYPAPADSLSSDLSEYTDGHIPPHQVCYPGQKVLYKLQPKRWNPARQVDEALPLLLFH